MFEYEDKPDEETGPVDYTGVKIGAILMPVFIFFICIGRPEIGFNIFIILGMQALVIKIRWRLRKHLWFWLTIFSLLAIHIPLLFIVHWPDTKVPTIAYTFPLGIVDFLVIMGVIGIAEKLFSKNHSASDDVVE